jgi:predicted dehydrogenase
VTPVRFIVAGLGSWGPSWAELIKNDPATELAAVVEPMDDRRNEVKQNLGLSDQEAWADIDEALESVAAEAILIVTPPRTHLDLARKAFAYGKPVLMEKPLAASMEDAQEIVNLAALGENILIVSQNYRYRPPMQAVRSVIESGQIGEILSIKANCQEDMRLFYEPTNFRYLMQHPHIIDMTIHHWDLLRFLTGREVDSVFATSWGVPDSPYQTDAECAILLKLDNGIPVLYEGSSATHRQRTSWSSWWEFNGSKGRLWTDGGVGDPHLDIVHLQLYGEEPVIVPNITVAPTDRHGSLYAFVNAVQGGELPAHTGRDNLNSLATVMACVESVDSGEQVTIAEILESV